MTKVGLGPSCAVCSLSNLGDIAAAATGDTAEHSCTTVLHVFEAGESVN